MLLASFKRRLEFELLRPPVRVVFFDELADSRSHGLDVLEDSTVDRLLFERPIEALGDTVGLWFLDEAEAGRDAPVPDLLLEVIRQVLATISMVS